MKIGRIARVTIATLLTCGLTLSAAAQDARILTGLSSSLGRVQDYTTARVSSEDRDGNADNRPMAPSETLTLAELVGPGEITHFWITIAAEDEDHLRNMVFRIYYDGKDYPSVESPIGDFFGLGHGMYYVFDNPVQAIGTDKGMNCFWPMPFRESARITVTNESDKKVHAFYYYVDYRTFDAPQDDIVYFHAQYRQAMPNKDGENYLIMETSGGRGHFAGVNLSIHTQTHGWWGEGDDIFTIDGEERPSIWGTGSEDYFGGAWCYGEEFYNNYFGMPLRKRLDQMADNFWNVYRMHLEMPVTFKESIKVEIEHGLDGVSNTRKPRNNDYSSCAYWYVDSPQPLVGELPPPSERMPKYRPLPTKENAIEALLMDITVPDNAEARPQEIGYPHHVGEWFNADQIWVTDQRVGQTATLEFETTQTMSGEGALYMTRAQDYGELGLKLNGKDLGKVDCYSDKIDRIRVPLGELTLEPGKHKLEVTVTGKNSRSTNTFWGIDYLGIGSEAEPESHIAAEVTPKK